MPIHGYPGGVITANPTAPTVSSASGVWTTEQQLIATAAGRWPMAATQVSLSARFNSADNAFLNRTPASASNRKTWTWSGWVKRSKLGAQQGLIGCSVGTSDSTYMNLQFNSGDLLGLGLYTQYVLLTTQVFRDPSAWYHIVVAFDTTNATANNRCRMYVNGVEITAFTTRNNPTQNADYGINQASQHDIGRSEYTNSTCLGGYLAEVNFIDGLALDPSYFGFNDSNTGAWTPKQYTGAYGTNGFYLPFNVDATSLLADYLVVAGGGGGGVVGGGGGGGGGYRSLTSQTVALGVAYTVTVGAGGTAGTSVNGGNGSNSVFNTITSTGGGGGGGDTRFSSGVAKSGGSGGGGGGGNWGTEAAGAGNTPSTSPSQGNNGGTGSASSPNYGGAGGGGAGATGGNGSGTTGGTGAAGTASSITGSSVTRAGGGGGGTYDGGTAGNGGSGGGGNGGVYKTPSGGSAATSGTANTGGGGGGGGISGGSAQSGGGGSGVVIIKIPDAFTATFSGGVTSSLSTAVSGFKIYTVTATSTTSETVTFS